MEQKYKGTIKDFPEEIVDRMLECQVEQGNPKNVSIFENNRYAGRNEKGFTWKETKENHDFWSAIINCKKFEKFYERYPKPTIFKFEVDKWYTHKAWTPRSFCKATESNSSFSNRIYYSEFIRNGEHIVKSDWWCCNEHITLASLEEIQEYLPEGHPDKIKTISEFKKGDYIVTLKGEFKWTSCGKENYCFKARETLYYLRPVIDLVGSNSNGNYTIKFDKSDKGCTDWRYATPEEIAEYDRLGKPFDVTTLSKKKSVNTTSLKDQVKAGLKLKGRWLKCIKDNSWKKNIEIGEYFQIDENCSSVPYVLYKNQRNSLDLERVDLLGEFELMPEGWTPETKETIVSEVPEYVECTKSNGSVWTFKPSTKEAYEAQNSTTKKEWSVGTYVVFIKDYGRSSLGDIDEIIVEATKNSVLKCKKEGVTTDSPDYTKWFATYEEAKKFSDFLLRTGSIFGTDKSSTISDLSYNPCGEIPVIKYYSIGIDPAIMQKPLTVKESYPTKETIKTQVISTNIINIPLKSKKKKQLFTI